MNRDVSKPSTLAGVAGRFPQTLWSVVLAASEPSSPKAERALATLFQAYWYPLYAFVRRRGHSPHDAEDLTQGFFMHLLEKQRLGQVSREKGKFRSFLLTSLRNYLADQHEKSAARKRGGGATVVSLDADQAEARYQCEPVDMEDPEKIFERRWAMTILERTFQRLEGEWSERSRQERFRELRPYLLGDPDSVSYADVGRRLGMTESAVKVAVLRLRGRYRELFRDEIANTVPDESELEAETRHLFAVLTA